MMLDLQSMAEITSLAMSAPTIILACVVVYVWLPSAVAAIRKHSGHEAHDWFIVGVTLGFAGAAMDNVYWSIPWTAAYVDHPAFLNLVHVGAFFNVVSRQLLGIVAAYCHLRAAVMSRAISNRALNALLVASNLLGVALAVALTFIRSYHLNSGW